MTWDDFERVLCFALLLAYTPKSKLGYDYDEWRIRQAVARQFQARWPT